MRSFNPKLLTFVVMCTGLILSTHGASVRMNKGGVRSHRVQSSTTHHHVVQSQSRRTITGTSGTGIALQVHVGNTAGQDAINPISVSGTNMTEIFTPTNVGVSGIATRTNSMELIANVGSSEEEIGSDSGEELNINIQIPGIRRTVKRIALSEYELVDLSAIMGDVKLAGRQLHRIIGKTISHKKFLKKYGYLDPTKTKFTKKEEQKALGVFQKFAGINVTGDMDGMTRMLMESSRCGVEDMLGSSRMGVMHRVQTNASSIFGIIPDVIEDFVRENAEIIENGNTRVVYRQVTTKFRHRPKRYYIQGSEWKNPNLTYHFHSFSPDLSETEIRSAIERAFGIWADVTPLSFTEIDDPKAADINIRFATGDHGDGKFAAFDGPGGTLAHAFFPENGDLHFDDDETFSVGSDDGIDLLMVATHELGHALGLEHSGDTGAIMYPWYLGSQVDFKLAQDDVDGIQQIYGKAPIERKEMEVNPAPDIDNLNFPDTCNSTWDAATYYAPDDVVYAFKGRYMWAIGDDGVLPGYPTKTKRVFKDAPSLVHAVLSIDDRLYMFRARKMWLYVIKKLEMGFPRPIPAGLPSGPNAAFRWGGNGKAYFFKGYRFYEFVVGEFKVEPPQAIRRQWPGVPVKLDAAFQWKNGRTYFFKGDQFWRYNDSKMKMAKGFPVSTSKHWLGCDSQ